MCFGLKKIKSLEIVDLNNNKLLKDLELKYSKLSKRLSRYIIQIISDQSYLKVIILK